MLLRSGPSNVPGNGLVVELVFQNRVYKYVVSSTKSSVSQIFLSLPN